MSADYKILSRNGTNSLAIAVLASMGDGFIPIGGVSVHSETRGRERITTYHQAMYLPE